MLAREIARALLKTTSQMTGNSEILARGYVVDGASHISKSDMYFSEHKYHFRDGECTKLLLEISDEDRGVVLSVTVNDISKLES